MDNSPVRHVGSSNPDIHPNVPAPPLQCFTVQYSPIRLDRVLEHEGEDLRLRTSLALPHQDELIAFCRHGDP